MPRYLRKLDFRRRKDWNDLQLERWIPVSDVPPELLDGWLDQSLSIWKIEGASDDEISCDIKEILFSLWHGIKTKPESDKILYITFDDAVVRSVEGLRIESSPGNTGIIHIDESKKHYEIKGLTGKKLCDMLVEILRNLKKTDIDIYKKSDYESATTKKLNELAALSSQSRATSITGPRSEPMPLLSATSPPSGMEPTGGGFIVQGSAAITIDPMHPSQSKS